jgi:hypothetical protein
VSVLALVVWRCNGCGRIEQRLENDGEPAPCMAHHRTQLQAGSEVLDLRHVYRWQRVGTLSMQPVYEGPPPRTLPAAPMSRRRPQSVEPLPDDAAMILAFEQEWAGRYRGKEAAVRRRFGMGYAVYEARLSRILDLPAAELHSPALIRRLRARRGRLRDVRRAVPIGPRGGPE